jgi:fructose-1,6-bisphosphatase II
MMEKNGIDSRIERNIAMELVRVTEAAALAAARFLGQGNRKLVDGAAIGAMRSVLGSIRMDGLVVIGEGQKDQTSMLYVGENIGAKSDLMVDIAVDPIDGSNLVARGLTGAISIVAVSSRGTIHCPREFVYMNKIVTGPEAKNSIDINAPVSENLKSIAMAKKRRLSELTVVVLDRPRHEKLIEDIRTVGCRVKLISDGDVAASIEAALPGRELDALMGVGGTQEGVISAAAILCLGGGIQCKAWPKDEEEKQAAIKAGVDLEKVYKIEDMISTEDVYFSATGVSSGELLKGVRYFSGGAQTQSLAMRSLSGTVRWIDSWHDFERLDRLQSFKIH